MGEFVNLEVTDGVGTIRLDRPKMNALNEQVQEEIRAAAQEATDRDDVTAVVQGEHHQDGSGPWWSTAASASSPPEPTSRRWPRCRTPTWSSAPADCSPR